MSAHLDPDILLVDEVLAVGDAGFQEKCFAKTREMSKLGKTVLVVSHQLDVVESLCHRVLYLNKGQTMNWGQTQGVLDMYRAHSIDIKMLPAC